MTAVEISRRFGCSVDAVSSWIREGKIRAEKVPHHNPIGYRWEILSTWDEIESAIGDRTRKRHRRVYSGPADPSVVGRLIGSCDVWTISALASKLGVPPTSIYSFIKRERPKTINGPSGVMVASAEALKIAEHFYRVRADRSGVREEGALARIEQKLDRLLALWDEKPSASEPVADQPVDDQKISRLHFGAGRRD